MLEEYQKAFDIVKESPFHKDYIEEKYNHSLQVAGAGNAILKNESFFQNQTSDFLEICRVAVLLHDIARFNEMVLLFQSNKKTDHGIEGAKFLKKSKEFNNILITLPIKHHGHMIEELYDDSEYRKLDDETQKQVQMISFAVRDADKIANWYPLCFQKKRFDFWFKKQRQAGEEKITDTVWQFLKQNKPVICGVEKTEADNAVSTFCWLFDINYVSSIVYCKKLNIFNQMNQVLRTLKISETYIDSFSKIIRQYIRQKFGIDVD